MKKSLYRQVMFVISSICLILLITIAVKIGVFSELTSCVLIIPGLFEPPIRTLRATIPENESHIFR